MKTVEVNSWGKGLRRNAHKFAGMFLVAMGLFWLAHKAGWIPVSAGGSVIFWPLLTIGVGLSILFGSRHGKTKVNN
jgi:hypothetical protein